MKGGVNADHQISGWVGVGIVTQDTGREGESVKKEQRR